MQRSRITYDTQVAKILFGTKKKFGKKLDDVVLEWRSNLECN